ncbi:uncharacterized protein BYT42DRAFT_609238 [Radiomyces spectabilis]|uniref:uncharacterized protein n=1 Tax=Radiomyces spectabilis TaxID=64574 RepID=UPI00221E93E7|nr:uncharacterized protein BYT42DRAFT_609238 [Radiomyces spectabilis]KAI8393444.1 hypothetical protein BYT42DRAFT_609238 [Radiomyces spectabilis]
MPVSPKDIKRSKNLSMPTEQNVELSMGISPDYTRSSSGHVSEQQTATAPLSVTGSPVFNDDSRVFYRHQKACICRGSGVGCDCSSQCSCR